MRRWVLGVLLPMIWSICLMNSSGVSWRARTTLVLSFLSRSRVTWSPMSTPSALRKSLGRVI